MPQATDFDAALGSVAAEPETVVVRVRRHGRALVLPVLMLLVIAGASGYWVGSLPEGWMNLSAAAGAIAAAFLFGAAPILAWLTRRITVTNRRVIFRHGIFVRHRSETPLARVREVRSRRGPIQRLCGAGTIDLHVGAERVTMPDVPGVVLVSDALQELVAQNYVQMTNNVHATSFFNTGMPMAAPPGMTPGTSMGVPPQGSW